MLHVHFQKMNFGVLKYNGSIFYNVGPPLFDMVLACWFELMKKTVQELEKPKHKHRERKHKDPRSSKYSSVAGAEVHTSR